MFSGYRLALPHKIAQLTPSSTEKSEHYVTSLTFKISIIKTKEKITSFVISGELTLS